MLQIKWVAFEQFLALYIILAIGADDVFVFMDAWKQSFYAGPKVLPVTAVTPALTSTFLLPLH